MQTVNFNAKDIFGKNFEILDSFNNVQIVSKGLGRVYKAMDKVDEEKKDDAGFLDYSNAIIPIVLDETCVLLGLTTKEDKEKMAGMLSYIKEKMKNLSYSTIQDFYAEACKKFTGIELPTIERMQENVKRAQALANGAAANDDEELTDPK